MELDLSSMMTDPTLANNPWPVYAGLRDHAPAIAAPFSRSRSGKSSSFPATKTSGRH